MTIDLGGGRSIRFGGTIDRVDICESSGKSYLRIIDYKSSPKAINKNTLAAGVNLQMLIYLFAATEPGAPFDGSEPAGVLYTPVSVYDTKLKNSRVPGLDSKAIEPHLKSSGLILRDTDVIGLMESGKSGRFIPAKLNADGTIYKYSQVISRTGLSQLKDYVYGELIGMAEELLSGNAEASPLKGEKGLPCAFCDFGDICGNADTDEPRLPDEEKLEQAENILKATDEDGKEEQ